MTFEPRFVPAFALMLSGFIVWMAHFGLIYAYAGLFCGRPEWARMTIAAVGIIPLGIAVLTLAAIVGLAAILAWNGLVGSRVESGNELFEAPFYRHLTMGGAYLGAVAIIWQGILSIALVPSCW